ncbi:hypothetical protein QTQ03_26655 [Micromonospora sp. WMMA1363]|nr:hypothetical protein [Micromonospora sp. WMMA1363]MDM4723006.1 hypothetical protein [Micromonospora sp. WMMA1363]
MYKQISDTKATVLAGSDVMQMIPWGKHTASWPISTSSLEDALSTSAG